MTHVQGSETGEEASCATLRRKKLWRYIRTCVLLFCPMLLHGCSMSETIFSFGPAAPAFVVVFDNDMTPTEDFKIHWAGLLANLAFVIGLVWAASAPSVLELVVSKSFRLGLWVFVLLTYCIFVPVMVWAWIYCIFGPTQWMASLVEPVATAISMREADLAMRAEYQETIMYAVGSRLYYAIFLTVFVLAFHGVAWFRRRVLQVSPDRWWQFSLRGWILLTVAIAILLGIIVRLLMPAVTEG